MSDFEEFLDDHKGKIGALLFVGILLTIIMVPLSFQYVERNEMGFKKNTATNDVDRSRVYTTGRYHFGLGRTIVSFPTTLQKVSLTGPSRLSVFADGGQTLFLDIEFYYQIPKERLAQLYERFVMNYDDPITTIASGELRNIASQFLLEDYLVNRRNVSDSLFEKLEQELRTKAFVSVQRRHFFIQRIYMPARILEQKTQIFTTEQQQETNANNANSSVIRLETTRQTTELDAQATLTKENATATATRLVADARSRAFQLVETERGLQVRRIIDTLGLVADNATAQLMTYIALLDKMLDSNATPPTILSGIQGAILQNP